jgi:peptidoglycan/LPS O-acetylase OafA/YrhL
MYPGMNRMEQGRNHEVDGLRGWAALGVLFFHFFQESFGQLFPFLHDPIFGFILNGHLMVLIFFILSGDALSASFFSSDDLNTSARVALARYFRLTFIIVISCLLSYILMEFGLTWNLIAAPIIHREDWLGLFLDFEQSIGSVVRYMIEGVYFHHNVDSSYNPFLWTMSIEMFGSMLVFVNLLILSKVREKLQIRILCIEFCFLWVFGEYSCLFILGMILGKLRTMNFFASLKLFRWNIVFLIAFVGVSFWLMPYHQDTLFSIVDSLSLNQLYHESYLFLWAGFVVFMVYSSRHLAWFFATGLSRYLGNISFPLYVIQFNVLVSITSFAILYANDAGFLKSHYAFIIPLTSVVITLVLATCIAFIERKFLKAMSRFISSKVMRPQ